MSTRALAAALAAAAALTACGAEEDPAPAGSDLSGTVTVLAAASLTEAFGEIGADLEAENPALTVTFSFGASSALAQQVVSGAPADVFAAASPTAMAVVTDAGDAADPQVFARNTLEIAVPAGNPGRVDSLADFADTSLTLALCAPAVPCGDAATKAFAAAGVRPSVDTLEQDVKGALAKVELGEVDAALVYRTDVLAAGDDVEGIAFPEAAQAVNDYPVAVLAGAPNAKAAAAFVDRVLSPEGQAVLRRAGFQEP